MWGRVGDCVGVLGSAAGSTGCPPAALSVQTSAGTPAAACAFDAAFFLATLGMYPGRDCERSQGCAVSRLTNAYTATGLPSQENIPIYNSI